MYRTNICDWIRGANICVDVMLVELYFSPCESPQHVSVSTKKNERNHNNLLVWTCLPCENLCFKNWQFAKSLSEIYISPIKWKLLLFLGERYMYVQSAQVNFAIFPREWMFTIGLFLFQIDEVSPFDDTRSSIDPLENAIVPLDEFPVRFSFQHAFICVGTCTSLCAFLYFVGWSVLVQKHCDTG